jgi:MFS-type transporter involved in bile tolerance (Atg22 family)
MAESVHQAAEASHKRKHRFGIFSAIAVFAMVGLTAVASNEKLPTTTAAITNRQPLLH